MYRAPDGKSAGAGEEVEARLGDLAEQAPTVSKKEEFRKLRALQARIEASRPRRKIYYSE